MSLQTNNKLFDAFNPQSKNSWLKKVEADLRLDNLADLDWSLGSNLMISPFAHAEDQKASYPPLSRNSSWRLGCPINIKDPRQSNQEALELLSLGCDALHFIIEDRSNLNDLTALLRDINLSWISVQFISTAENITYLRDCFHQYLDDLNIDPKTVRAAWGATDRSIPDANDIDLIKSSIKWSPTIGSILLMESPIDTFDDHLAALSSSLHHANQILKSTNQFGGLPHSCPSIQFAILTQENYYSNIACLRAFRILWHNILKAWNLEQPSDILLQAIIINSPFPEDQNLEKISFTAQALSAVVGGADQIVLTPNVKETQADKARNRKRLHLNIQHLLKLESHFDWVSDPAAGSYFLEKLTMDIAEQIWHKFQELEKNL